MKMRTLPRSGAFALVLAVAGLGGAAAARAGVITLDVSASLVRFSGTAACSPACALGGDIVINTTTGAFVSADVTTTGFTPSVGPFTVFAEITAFGGLTAIDIEDSGLGVTSLFFSTPTPGSLVDYTGGALDAVDSDVVLRAASGALIAAWNFTSGSLTEQPAAVSEPSSLLLLLSALTGLGSFLGIRRLWKRTAPC